MPTTFTEVLPPTKTEKSAAITWEPADEPFAPTSGTLTITGKRTHCCYRVSEFPSDFAGRAFVLEKLLPGSDKNEGHYSVLISESGARICDCKGHASTGACKHVAALEALLKNQQI